MKKIIIPFLFAAAVLAVSGCAKQAVSGPNDANKRYFDAWIKVNHPEARQTELGVYIIEDEPGTGAEVKEGGFVLMDYIATNLEGNIASSTYKETAEQLGNYSETAYYGPKFQTTTEGTIHAGLLDAMEGMKVGGHRKVAIPTWLMTYSTHKTEKEFLDRLFGLNKVLCDNKKVYGLCYTQLTDVEQEVNGLYTYDRRPKFDPAIIKEFFTQEAVMDIDEE